MPKLANIPANCEFPQLRDIADTEKLAPTLQRHLGPAFASGEMQVESCAIDQLNYTPAGGCWILFAASIRRRDTGALGQQIYYGKLFRPQRAAQAWANNLRKTWAPPKFGPALVYIPEWAMLLWAYPNDPNLPGLAQMDDAEKILAQAQAAPEKFGLAQPPAAITAERTKYVPGQRCGFIYKMTFAGGAEPVAVYGKAYQNGEGEKAFALMQQIWESAPRRRGDLVLPQPFSYDHELQVLWQEALSGQPFAKIAETITNLPEAAEEIGARLAAFHGAPLQLPVEMTFDFQVEKVRQAVKTVARVFPDFAERCAAAGQKLLEVAAQLGPGPLAPVHASFKFSHIFATEKGIAFIDFDGANFGDPGYDIGRFIAHLYKMKANWKIDPDAAELAVANFCESYNRAAASPLPQQRINWFAASHLLASQVYKSVKRMDTSLVGKLLKTAERLCSS